MSWGLVVGNQGGKARNRGKEERVVVHVNKCVAVHVVARGCVR